MTRDRSALSNLIKRYVRNHRDGEEITPSLVYKNAVRGHWRGTDHRTTIQIIISTIRGMEKDEIVLLLGSFPEYKWVVNKPLPVYQTKYELAHAYILTRAGRLITRRSIEQDIKRLGVVISRATLNNVLGMLSRKGLARMTSGKVKSPTQVWLVERIDEELRVEIEENVEQSVKLWKNLEKR